jgi:hypothetical protein
MTDGIEWNTMTVIGGRPASGKTLIVEQIIRESFILNPAEDFRVLQFQFEMLARSSAIREYSSIIGKSYKYLCSADGQLSPEDLQKCYNYAKEKVKYPIDIVEKPCTVDEFIRTIQEYMAYYSTVDDNGVRHFKKYTIDAVLGKVDSFLYEDKLPIGGTEVCFSRNTYNNYTTKEILFSDQIINGTESRLEFYETLTRSVSNSIVLYQIDIYLENIDENIFNYLNSRNAHIWQQNSITQLPTNVIGNIKNGFGIIGGYTNDVIKIKLRN